MKKINNFLLLIVGSSLIYCLHAAQPPRGLYPSFEEPYVPSRPEPSAPFFEEEEYAPGRLEPSAPPYEEVEEVKPTPEETATSKRVRSSRRRTQGGATRRQIGSRPELRERSYQESPEDWWMRMGQQALETPLGQAIQRRALEKAAEVLGSKAEEQKPSIAEQFKAYLGRREQVPTAAMPAAGQASQLQPRPAPSRLEALRGAAAGIWQRLPSLPRFGEPAGLTDLEKNIVNMWDWNKTISYLNYIAKKNNVKISVYDLATGNLKQTVGESIIDQIKDNTKNISKMLSEMGLTFSTNTVLSAFYTLGYLTKEQHDWLNTVAKYSSAGLKIEALKIAQATFERDMSSVEYTALDYVIKLLTYLYQIGIIK